MKHTTSLLAYCLLLLASSAAVPLKWTVETSSFQPATFDVVRGETLDFEARLQSAGKPLPAPAEYAFYWQTNGMDSAWWSVPCATPSFETNVLFASWLPEYDVGAKSYRCVIGLTGSIFRAAFTLLVRHGPGATPNELPLPQKVIDFSRVTVLNPPWPSGAARPLPAYLHTLDFDESYPDAAAAYYRSRGDGKVDGGCSAVRDGGFLYRNFDFPLDERAEFVVKMAAGPGRFASVGVAQVGTNLTEQMVTSGKPSRWYKSLPGATVDGINENGVVVEVNVVDGDPQWRSGVLTASDIHPLAAVRWVLDNATSAGMAASNLVARIIFPSGWEQNFHWMLADSEQTWIVENGTCSNVTGRAVMTNFPLIDRVDGMGLERYNLLVGGESITNAWFTRAYSRSTNWESEFKDAEEMEAAKSAWETYGREELRSKGLWQTVHCSIYDISNRVLRIAVQEVDDWYVFQMPVSGGYTKAEADARFAAKGDVPTRTSQLANDSGYFSSSDGYTTNVIAKASRASVPFKFGSEFGGSTWSNRFFVTVQEKIGEVNSPVFTPRQSVSAYVDAYNIWAVDEYDPQEERWIYTGEWRTNFVAQGYYELEYAEDEYDGITYRTWQAGGDGFSIRVHADGDLNPSSSVSWNSSSPYSDDSGAFPISAVADCVDRFLSETELKKVVPRIENRVESTVTVKHVEVHEYTNVVVRESRSVVVNSNVTHDVWKESTREIVPTNMTLESGQAFAGLRISATNRLDVIPVIGTSPVVRLDAPYQQGAYTSRKFSAIEIGNFYQALFSQRIQAGTGIWVPSLSSIRFYDDLSTNEYDTCRSMQDVINDITAAFNPEAIQAALRSGYVSAYGGVYDHDYVFGSVSADSVSADSVSADSVSAEELTVGRMSITNGIAVSDITVPDPSAIRFERGSGVSNITDKISQMISRNNDNPHSRSVPSPVTDRIMVEEMIDDAKTRNPEKLADFDQEIQEWWIRRNGYTYTISREFYEAEPPSYATTVYINLPNCKWNFFVGKAPDFHLSSQPEIVDGKFVNVTIFCHSLPPGVVVRMPWKIYTDNGWTIRYFGDRMSEVLGVGDYVRIRTGDEKLLIVETHRSTIYETEQGVNE